MYDRAREIDEAIDAGRRALDALEEAADALDDAKRWGIVDILGGGVLTSVVKHARLAEAEKSLSCARAQIMSFSHEMADVREVAALSADLGSWTAFFDIALDNWLTDVFVQRDISDAADRVDEAIEKVSAAVCRLEAIRGR